MILDMSRGFWVNFVSVLAYFLNKNNIGGTTLKHGVIALSAQRLLPCYNRL